MRGSTAAELTAAARRLHGFLCAQIAPEVAASAEIKAVHAIRRPLGLVEIAGPASRTGRTSSPLAMMRVAATSDQPQSPILIGGEVAVDRLTAGAVEIHAEGAALISGAFDDPARARTRDEATQGLWPRSRLNDDRRTPQELYGFDVDPRDG